jgi:hypothetical protein
VSRQLIIESDRESLEARMNMTRENFRISRETLLKIISLRQKQLRRVRGACLVSGCRCDHYVPDTEQPLAANRYNGRMLRKRR